MGPQQSGSESGSDAGSSEEEEAEQCEVKPTVPYSKERVIEKVSPRRKRPERDREKKRSVAPLPLLPAATGTGKDLCARMQESPCSSSSSALPTPTTSSAPTPRETTTSLLDSTPLTAAVPIMRLRMDTPSAGGRPTMNLIEYERMAHLQASAAAERARQLTFGQFATDPYYSTLPGAQLQLEVQLRAQKAAELAFEHQLSFYFEPPRGRGPRVPTRRFLAMCSRREEIGTRSRAHSASATPTTAGTPHFKKQDGGFQRAPVHVKTRTWDSASACLSPVVAAVFSDGSLTPKSSGVAVASRLSPRRPANHRFGSPAIVGTPPTVSSPGFAGAAVPVLPSTPPVFGASPVITGALSPSSSSSAAARAIGGAARGGRVPIVVHLKSPGAEMSLPPRLDLSEATRMCWSSADSSPVDDLLEPTAAVFTWPHGGRLVYLCHSGDSWKHKYRMHRSPDDDFTLVLELKPGVYHYKFIVDSTWRCAPDQRLVRDSTGAFSNVMEVRSASFATIDERKKQAEADEFNCEMPLAEAFIQEPPTRPPHLAQIILNTKPKAGDHPLILDKPQRVTLHHLHVADSCNEGVVTVGSTQRFKGKFITTVFYKSISA